MFMIMRVVRFEYSVSCSIKGVNDGGKSFMNVA